MRAWSLFGILQPAPPAFLAWRANARSSLYQPANANPGGGITSAEIHLSIACKLFKETEPPLYGISRPTGDKWLAHYHAQGVVGLADMARRPHTQPHQTPEAVVEAILAMKHRHPSFGPKKIRDRLRAVVPADPQRLSQGTAAAPTWSADFKGDFPLGTGQRCYPLTVMDHASRYLLRCQGVVQPTAAVVQPWLAWVFHEYGLPTTMRTDTGPPFASTALGGLSRLAAWWVRLGIRPERIRPGTPSENGCHERMHRALKAAVGPPAATLAAQQRRLARFVEEYNWERSHEALARQTPGQVYQPSPRSYPAKLPPIEYAPGTLVRQVRHNGEVRWRGTCCTSRRCWCRSRWASRRSGRAPGRSIIVFIGWGPWMSGR